MSQPSPQRVTVDLSRSIIAFTVITVLIAAFVLASEIILILFLGVLFGVFLTKLSSWIVAKTPIGYRGSLATVVIALLLTVAGVSTFFFVQINHQVEEASGKFDEGMNELRRLIDENPALQSTIATTPFISEVLGVENQASQQQTEPSDATNNAENDDSSNSSGLQITRIPEPVKQAVGTIGQMFKTTFGLVVNSLLIFFVGLFLAISPGSYRDGIACLTPRPKRQRITKVLDTTGNALWRWLIGRFGSMLATGFGAFLLLMSLGVPMAGTLGMLTAVLTFVPNIGAAVALFLAIIVALPQGTGTVISVFGGYIALQLFESYVITPLIQQKAVSLPPALLIAFQAIMGVLFGFIGAAVASPLLAAGKTVIEMLYVDDYLESDSSRLSD